MPYNIPPLSPKGKFPTNKPWLGPQREKKDLKIYIAITSSSPRPIPITRPHKSIAPPLIPRFLHTRGSQRPRANPKGPAAVDPRFFRHKADARFIVTLASRRRLLREKPRPWFFVGNRVMDPPTINAVISIVCYSVSRPWLLLSVIFWTTSISRWTKNARVSRISCRFLLWTAWYCRTRRIRGVLFIIGRSSWNISRCFETKESFQGFLPFRRRGSSRRLAPFQTFGSWDDSIVHPLRPLRGTRYSWRRCGSGSWRSNVSSPYRRKADIWGGLLGRNGGGPAIRSVYVALATTLWALSK